MRRHRWKLTALLALYIGSWFLPPVDAAPRFNDPEDWYCEVDGVAGMLIYDGTCVTPAVYDVWYPAAGLGDGADPAARPSDRPAVFEGKVYRSFAEVVARGRNWLA